MRETIDTTNWHLVTAHNGRVIVGSPAGPHNPASVAALRLEEGGRTAADGAPGTLPPGTLTQRQAILFAAWLVCAADMAKHDHPYRDGGDVIDVVSYFGQALQAIRNA